MNTNYDWKNIDTKRIFEAILNLETQEDCAKFFRDLMTEQEIEIFAARFKAALMLDQGVSYREISKQTGMSTATVTRINNWLERGMGGYKQAIKRLKDSSKKISHHHTSKNSLDFTS